MKGAIVTGANGFIGSALVRELLKHDVNIWALDREGAFSNIPIDKRVRFIPFELDDINSLAIDIPVGKCDTLFHLAWSGSAGEGRTDSALQLRNAQWSVDAVRLAKRSGCSRFLSAGSIMEHETLEATLLPGNKPGLAYIYGGAKLIAHIMCSAVAANIGIDLLWPEITNAYGVGEYSPRLINSTIRKIIDGESPKFTSGTQNYDFVYIDDVARAFYMIAKNGKPFSEYLIGSSNAKPLKEFLLEMKTTLSPSLEFYFGDVPFTGTNLDLKYFDCSKTEAETGFRAEISFTKGVQLTMDWLEELKKAGK